MAKTGLELLEELVNKISILDKRLITIEYLMKELLNNKNAKVINEILPIKEEIKTTKGSVKIELNEKLDMNEINNVPEIKKQNEIKVSEINEPKNIPESQNVLKNACEIKTIKEVATNDGPKTRVIGRIKNKNGKGIPGVNLKVYNETNEMIKETRSNSSGEWICLLPVGNYKAVAYLENIINKSINFTINSGDTVFRPAMIQAD